MAIDNAALPQVSCATRLGNATIDNTRANVGSEPAIGEAAMTLQSTIHRIAVGVTGAAVVAAFMASAPGAAFASSSPRPTPTLPAPVASVNQPFTNAFEHYGNTGGQWTGADSSYSVPLPGGRVAWLYSDTFLGTVNADNSRPLDSPFIHNSIVIQNHGQMTTYTGGPAAAPTSLVAVPGADPTQDWYWFGDGTVEGNHLQVLLLEFTKTGDGPFDFAFKDTAIASISLATMQLEHITTMPDSAVEWGSAIYESGPYTYVYGVEDLGQDKYMHLARVRTGGLTTSPWQYFDGSGWSVDPTSSTRIMDGVSNEFSVTNFLGAVTLVTGDTTQALSPDIVMYRSTSPEGPFTDKTLLYTTPETSGNIFTYNPKAHPEFGTPNTLMITYNVNSFSNSDLYSNVDNYRPRYINVTFPLSR